MPLDTCGCIVTPPPNHTSCWDCPRLTSPPLFKHPPPPRSVLEPGRSLTLAEKGGAGAELVVGAPGFLVLATMNPGGDFGKKELSPALSNRFTQVGGWGLSLNDSVTPAAQCESGACCWLHGRPVCAGCESMCTCAHRRVRPSVPHDTPGPNILTVPVPVLLSPSPADLGPRHF